MVRLMQCLKSRIESRKVRCYTQYYIQIQESENESLDVIGNYVPHTCLLNSIFVSIWPLQWLLFSEPKSESQ